MSDRKVAFSAVADHGGPVGPNCKDTTVIFNKLITSVGCGYNQTSGVFTAPVAGLYYFTFFFHTGSREKSELTLIKNSAVVVTAAVTSTASESTSGGGNAAVLNLDKGDKVSVRLPANCRVWGSDNATSFSGFLIH